MGVWAKRKEKAKWTIYSTKKPLWTTDTNEVKFGQGLMEKMGWSVGKGLGVNEQGIQEPLRVSYKNDTKGVGFKENDNWSEYQDEFNSLLMQLRNSDDSHVIKIPEGEKNEFKSLEEKSKQSRTRVHYQKFTRGKDLSRYSENDLACIIGTSKKKEKSKNEPTVTDNLETSFGVTTINSGSIQDYFKKKWIINQKPSNSAGATETTVEHYAMEKACFSLGEVKPEENENLEGDQNKFLKRKHKSNSNSDLLKINDSSELDELEKSKKSEKKRKKKETRDVDSEEEPNIKKIKKNYANDNIRIGEALQENKALLSEVLDNKKKGQTQPLENEDEDDSKNHLKSEILADEENLKYFKIKKRKKNTENYNLQDVVSSNSVSETNQKENSSDVKLFKKKKKKEKREKRKENEETENQDYSVISDMPSNEGNNKDPCVAVDKINDPNERVNTLEIEFNTKKKKKKKKEKSKENDKISTVHSCDENSGRAIESCLEINLVKKKKRKKDKYREKEKIRDSSNNSSAHSNDEEDKTNTESTLEIESVKKRKSKKEGKKNFNENKDILNVSQNEEFCSKDACTEKVNATNDTESVPELITSKKKKKKNKNEKLLEKEELPSFNCGENRETLVEQEKVNVATGILEVGSVKKKKKKREKKEKNFSENLTENKIIKSCNHKDSEEKNKFEKSDFEISNTLSSSNYSSNNNAANINNDNINTRNRKISGNNNGEEADVLNAKVEESGMHKHKLELLSEKTIDKFYPGYDTNARIQKLIHWTSIEKFKGSNLGNVLGYGNGKKFQANESR